MFEYKSSAKTISDAIKLGIDTLKVDKEKVKIKVLRNAKNLQDAQVLIVVPDAEVEKNEEIKKLQSISNLDKQISSIEKQISKTIEEKNEILETLKAELLQKTGQEVLQEDIVKLVEKFIFDIMKISGQENFKISAKENEKHISIEIEGNDLGKFIGGKGKTLASIQFLANIYASTLSRKTKHVLVDINSYKKNKIEKLTFFAIEKAKEVSETGKEFCFEPMNAFERHIVHDAVSAFDDLKTESQGKEPKRFIVISKK